MYAVREALCQLIGAVSEVLRRAVHLERCVYVEHLGHARLGQLGYQGNELICGQMAAISTVRQPAESIRPKGLRPSTHFLLPVQHFSQSRPHRPVVRKDSDGLHQMDDGFFALAQVIEDEPFPLDTVSSLSLCTSGPRLG